VIPCGSDGMGSSGCDVAVVGMVWSAMVRSGRRCRDAVEEVVGITWPMKGEPSVEDHD
jgi:hypothetical protein